MYLKLRNVIPIALLAIVTGLTACGGIESTEQNHPRSSMTEAELEALGRQARQTLARALALSLNDPAMRALLRAAMAQSLVKEEKVHFGSYARGPGRDLLQSMSRHSRMSVAELEELLAQAGSLEMYLPVKKHRAAWKGGEDLLVATQYQEHEAPIAFNPSGEPVTLSVKEPPATPTLVLVPAEDFQADGTPTKRGLALGRGGPRMQTSAELATGDTTLPGVYVNSVHIPDTWKYESWLLGDPEFEFYLGRVQDSREQLRCASEHSDTMFWWNMDGETWTSPFVIGWEDDLPPTGFAMFIYEDDDLFDGCKIREGKDHVKLTLDSLKASNGNKALQMKQEGSIISFFHGDVKEGETTFLGADEYVGTVTSSGVSIDEETRAYAVMNEDLQTTATVQLQWRTPSKPGVVFVHGTGDHSPEKATTDYWTRETLATMSNGLPYLVVGYPGKTCAAFDQCSWGSIVDQIVPWVAANGITSFTVITHSNGANPVRYMLGHPGAVSAQGHRAHLATDLISQVIFTAPTLQGTHLADIVNTSGHLAQIILGVFGVDVDLHSRSLMQQSIFRMLFYNAFGVFAGQRGATTVGGKPIAVVRGTGVSLIYGACGGWLETLGLKLASIIGWAGVSLAFPVTDGFIDADSSGYFGNIVISSPILNHNQSRRGCHGSGSAIATMVSTPPDPASALEARAPAEAAH